MADSENNLFQQASHVFKAIPAGKKLSFAITFIIVIGGFIALLVWANRPDFQVLFSNLVPSDASQITEKLKEKGIPFQLKEGGKAVLVPDNMVYQLRLDMASKGIPRGRNVGFEIFDEVHFGTTHFVQKLKYKQALQGELARTIMQFDSIDRARVHIVTAGDSLFAEPEKPATASVVLRLHNGKILNRQHLQGIINLVACAVQGLKPEKVTIVDMAGGLLSKGSELEIAGTISRAQYDYQQTLEKTIKDRIQSMLEAVVGLGSVVARVSAEVDFKQVNISEEQYDPDNLVVRSEQRDKETSMDGKKLPSGSPDLKNQLYQSQGRNISASKGFKREKSTVNYEINKISKQVISSVGDIKRLTAAVIIDGPYLSEKTTDGKTVRKFSGRSKKELKIFEDIVKKAIGFNVKRGDQVTVSNIPFAMQEDKETFPEDAPSWIGYAKKGAKPLFNIFLVGLFFIFIIKPFKKWLKQAEEYGGSRGAALPQGGDIPQLGTQNVSGQEALPGKEQLLNLTKEDPGKAADIIRNWMSEEK